MQGEKAGHCRSSCTEIPLRESHPVYQYMLKYQKNDREHKRQTADNPALCILCSLSLTIQPYLECGWVPILQSLLVCRWEGGGALGLTYEPARQHISKNISLNIVQKTKLTFQGILRRLQEEGRAFGDLRQRCAACLQAAVRQRRRQCRWAHRDFGSKCWIERCVHVSVSKCACVFALMCMFVRARVSVWVCVCVCVCARACAKVHADMLDRYETVFACPDSKGTDCSHMWDAQTCTMHQLRNRGVQPQSTQHSMVFTHVMLHSPASWRAKTEMPLWCI